MVTYNVTNNANTSLSNLVVQQPISTTGKSSLISLQANTCTGTLAAGGKCSFQLLIKGANNSEQQPSSFTISPEICSFNSSLCIGTTTLNNLTVQTYSISATPFAYLGVLYSGSNKNNLVPINSASLLLGTPTSVAYDWTIPHEDSPVAVSMDGSRVYTLEAPSGNLIVLSSGSAPQILDTIALGLFPLLHPSIVVSPDGNTIYVAGTYNGILGYSKIYVVSYNQGTYTVSTPSFDDTSFIYVGGMAVSPDGKTLYVSDYWGGNDIRGAFYAFDIHNNYSRLVTLNNNNAGCNFHLPNQLAVMPDNQTIYVDAQASPQGMQVISNDHGVYTCSHYLSYITDQTNGMTITPDGKYLYTASNNVANHKIYVIDTQNNSALTSATLPSGIYPFGVAVTPDGSQLFVSTNIGSSTTNAYVFSLSNGLPNGNPTGINMTGPQSTIGQFIN